MPLNLIAQPWLEVRRASRRRDVVRPCDLTSDFDSDPIVALDFPRPDWNAALTEFLIGLLFLSMPPEDEEDWAEAFTSPPSPEALARKFDPLASLFEFDADGACAFQDLDSLGNQEIKPLAGLLIDAPGENTIKNNSDLFVKRGAAGTLSLPYAAAALITLQTYAPAGGAGHRTSLRGGGPLTTLIAPVRAGSKHAILWDKLWANTPDCDPSNQLSVDQALPWMRETLTSEKQSQLVTPEGRHPALAFFACPRRIRLVVEGDGEERRATGFRTVNYGANYLGWRHPLSPYRDDKKAGLLPIHPHAGASDYGDWLAWWGFDGAQAEASGLWRKRRMQLRRQLGAAQQAEAVGFDMDNMKARQWLDARLPWVDLHEDELKNAVRNSIQAADEAARALRRCVKLALYGSREGPGYRLPDKLPTDASPEPADRFWRETQSSFEAHLEKLIERLTLGRQPTADLLQNWLNTLRQAALRIFDETVDLDGLTEAEPKRLLYARGRLGFEFAHHSKASVFKALQLNAAPDLNKRAEA